MMLNFLNALMLNMKNKVCVKCSRRSLYCIVCRHSAKCNQSWSFKSCSTTRGQLETCQYSDKLMEFSISDIFTDYLAHKTIRFELCSENNLSFDKIYYHFYAVSVYKVMMIGAI